jgi:hypothetical protein
MTFENFHEMQLWIGKIEHSLKKWMDPWKKKSYPNTKLGHGN